MMERVMFSAKVDKELAGRADAYAKSRDRTRTELIHAALESFLDLASSGVPEIASMASREGKDRVQEAEPAKDPLEGHVDTEMIQALAQHEPKPGRHAAVCPKCQTRVFFGSAQEARGWRCPEHGVGKIQAPKPYFGRFAEEPDQMVYRDRETGEVLTREQAFERMAYRREHKTPQNPS